IRSSTPTIPSGCGPPSPRASPIRRWSIEVKELATPLADWVIIVPLVLCLMGGALLLMLRRFVRVQVWLCLGRVLLVLACEIALFMRVFSEGPVSMTMGNWLPPFGISFTADMA